jgi:hypothetical protein
MAFISEDVPDISNSASFARIFKVKSPAFAQPTKISIKNRILVEILLESSNPVAWSSQLLILRSDFKEPSNCPEDRK